MSADSHQKIGLFIRELRRKRGLTQKAFANALKTSQSAVARMEKGDQNLSTSQLLKISDVLHHQVVGLKRSVDFEIEGDHKLHGTAVTNTSKNGALALMCASLLNKAPTILHGIPRIEEIYRMIEVFKSIGVQIDSLEENALRITPPKIFRLSSIDKKSARSMRSVLMLIAPLVHHKGDFNLPHAGGCNMGDRTIAAHKHALEALGVRIKTHENQYLFAKKTLKPAEIIMYEASDTATINALMTAALIPGKTVIKYAPPNYQVQDVCFLLRQYGVRIDGVGTTTLTVYGVDEIDKKITHHNSEDPIESMMFISAAVVTKSELKITRCPIEFLEVELLKLSYMGLRYEKSKLYFAKNGKTKLVDITVYPSELKASPLKIHPLPYPGLNIDNLPFFVPIATQAKGTTLIHDWAWEGRAIYFTELNRLGADVKLADPHRVFVTGVTELKAAQVVCPPALRPAVIVLIAMLAAKGTSVLRNVYSIERGYERIAERLSEVGAHIEIVSDL
ncbi:MAG: UDP-N-acetylglucosamine 1-carboxyvinyltransferase [Candidatus Pacebacteria bacterium]|nr:UDP-N-acetylglucosamine 1-carboxyvinyltransferase [Candidatus Paceibacterota bacterium]